MSAAAAAMSSPGVVGPSGLSATSLGVFAQHVLGNTQTLTTIANAPTGSTIAVGATTDASTIHDVADSVGNTYLPLTQTSPTGEVTAMFYAKNITALPPGGTITLTTAGGATRDRIFGAACIAGVSSNPLDKDLGTAVNIANATPSIATGVLAQANELIIGLDTSVAGGSDSYTEASGFTFLLSGVVAGGLALHMSYQIVAATTTVSFAPTLGVARVGSIHTASFKK